MPGSKALRTATVHMESSELQRELRSKPGENLVEEHSGDKKKGMHRSVVEGHRNTRRPVHEWGASSQGNMVRHGSGCVAKGQDNADSHERLKGL